MKPITIEIRPRAPFRPYIERPERWACLVVHRRGGKTFACVQDLLEKAVKNPRRKPPPRYAYVAPTRDQAKDIAWPYVQEFWGKLPGATVNQSELKVTLSGGQSLRLYSGDSYERMRGLYFDGVVLDEFEDMDPLAWTSVIRPTLTDYNGWATFIGTPKGRGALWRTFKGACADDAWFSLLLRSSDSGLIDEEELEEIRRDPQMTEALFRQEFECDFSVPRPGAVYARFVEDALAGGRVLDFPWSREDLVYTSWDLGSPQNTRTLYWQAVGREIHLIDHDAGLDMSPTQRVAHLTAKGYPYGGHFLPHDAAATEKSGKNFEQQLREAGLEGIRIVPRCRDVWPGINKMAEVFPRIVFRATQTEALRDALTAYHTREDKSDGHVTNIPVHDWSSHDADAFRIFGEAMMAGFLRGAGEVVREHRRRGRAPARASAGRYRG